MKKIMTLFTAIIALSSMIGCAPKTTAHPPIPELPHPHMTDAERHARILSPEVMLKMLRIGGSALSPDGSEMVYSLGIQDIEGNGSHSNLNIVNTTTKATHQLIGGKPYPTGPGKYFSPSWSGDGNTIYYLSTIKNGSQLWSISKDGKKKKQITDIEGGINGYDVSPKGDKIWYVKRVQVDKTKDDFYPNLKKSSARIYDDLMVRHWDRWTDGTYSHLFVADLIDGKLSNDIDIVAGESWDVPTAPYFSTSEITWDNSGDQIAYTAKKMGGTEYTLSTDSDIYIYNIADRSTKNITKGMPGYDKYPVFSQDDSMIAFSSMERAGNESDKTRLMIYDVATGDMTNLTKDFDSNSSTYVWSGNTVYFISPLEATYQICSVDAKGDNAGKVNVITKGDHTIGALKVSKDKLYANFETISSCVDLVSIDRNSAIIEKLTDVNKHIYPNITMGEVQKRWVKTTDGKNMLVWVILPPNFDETKKYPTLLYCQGGPQSTVASQWSFRWNFQLMAAQGYVVVAPNRRGLPSFGQEWLDQISGDYSGQNIKDYLSAIDDVSKESWVDKDALGCVGASYGGYSAFFLAGNHDERFKAFISHCGMFNLESFYGSTEELWFPTNDLGGSPYSKDLVAKRSYRNSPHKFVKNWDTPILIITGEKDYRIPYTQSLEAFTAARLMGVDARLVSFADEAHQVFKPQNALVWHSEFFNWLDKYLKK